MHRWTGLWLPLVALAAAVPAAAQTSASLPQAAAAPVNIILPNYSNVAVGEIGGLEGNAYLARVGDSSAAYYNPAGLTLATKNSVSGSGGAFQTASVSPEGFSESGTSFRHIPTMTSFILKELFGSTNWAGGLSMSLINSFGQSVNGQRSVSSGAASNRIMYSSLGEMSAWMANAGVGYTSGGKWRVGATVDGQLMQFVKDEALSNQHVTASALSAAVIQARASAWTWHFRLSAGAQYDVRPGFRVAVAMRTPGLQLLSGGSFNHEGMANAGTTTVTASFFDPEPDVRFRLPFEFKAGAAWIGSRAQVEVDLLTYTGRSPYQALETSESWTIITDPGTGATPAVQHFPFERAVIDVQAVVNLAVGGQVNLTSSGSWKLHGGYTTDRSPVGPDDTFFTQVHMQAFTLGMSGRKGLLLGSIGLRYATGKSGDIPLRAFQDVQPVTTRLKVSNVGIVYSVALLF
jgi:hypothetical protein